MCLKEPGYFPKPYSRTAGPTHSASGLPSEGKVIARIQPEQIFIINGLAPFVDDRRNVGIGSEHIHPGEKVAAVPGLKELELAASTYPLAPSKEMAFP